MNKVEPRVSVVIPHFNQVKYLAECLRSLQKQTLTEWEAIVVDDASTQEDPSELIANLNDARVRLIRLEVNSGPGRARNAGGNAAVAPFVLPLDADDYLDSSYLEKTTKVLDNNPDTNCVYVEFQLFGASDQIWRFDLRPTEEILTHQWIPGAGTLMRRSFWESVGGYSEVRELSGNEDWEFWIRAMQKGCKPMKVAEPLYWYRRHPDSATANSLPYRDYTTREIIYRMHRNYFEQHDAGAKFRGEGFLNSSTASLKVGKRGRAAWLAFRGLVVEPRSVYLQRLLVRTLTPEVVIRAIKPFRRGTSAG